MHATPKDWAEVIGHARDLAKQGDEKGLEDLLSALRWRYERARTKAIEALVELGSPTVPRLVRILKSGETATERGAAADTLGLLKSRRAVPQLKKALFDANMVVRRAAITALWRIGVREAVPQLLQLLTDESGGVRVLAAQVLGGFSDPASVPDLMDALKDSKWYVRQAAAEALGAIGDARAVEALRHARHDPRAAVSRAARKALAAFQSE